MSRIWGGACGSLGWRPSFLAGGCLLGYPSRLELLVEAGGVVGRVGGGLCGCVVVVEGLRGSNHCHGWVGWLDTSGGGRGSEC